MKSPNQAPIRDDFDHRLLAELPSVRAFLRKLSAGDEEDLCQETMARALRYRHRAREDGSLRGWLLRMAFRVFLDQKSKNARSPRALGAEAEIVEWTETESSTKGVERREEIELLLACLSEIERAILLQFHRDGASIEEIATSIGMPVGTVKSHLHRARKRMSRIGPTTAKNEDRSKQ